jgi:hypothetical protein
MKKKLVFVLMAVLFLGSIEALATRWYFLGRVNSAQACSQLAGDKGYRWYQIQEKSDGYGYVYCDCFGSN